MSRESGPTAEEFMRTFPSLVIIWEGDFLALNKPAGYPIHSPTLACPFSLNELVQQATGAPFNAAHRLDRDTTGVLVASSSSGVRRSLCNQFKRGEVEKRYVAVLDGEVQQETVEVHSGNAQTIFQVLAYLEDEGTCRTLVEARPRTGRTHQIRIHAAEIGLPITGDREYNPNAAPAGVSRQLLHAFELSFCFPRTRVQTTLQAPLFPDFRGFISSMRVLPVHSILDELF